MPKLSDLINTDLNRDVIKIQGVDIPIMFSMETFEIVQQAYGKPYRAFEADLNNMLKNKNGVKVNNNTMRIMYALIYAMIKTGGTDCTLQEVRGGVPIADLQEIFQKVLDIFNEQDFQQKDLNRMRQSKSKKS